MVPIEHVSRNPRNPRRNFDPADLEDLSRSIRQHGVVQPVVVRTAADGRYEIIAGERRWRAAQMAGLVEIPVIVRDVDDKTALEIAIVENVQRADLNPLEEAQGYEQLIAQYGYTQNDLGEVIGKSRSHVANSLRLLKLPDEVRQMLSEGALSAGHARAIVSTSDPVGLAKDCRWRVFRFVMRKSWHSGMPSRVPVRQRSETKSGEPSEEQGSRIRWRLKSSLSDVLGLKVQLAHKGQGGQLRIDYKTLEQLDELCRLLGDNRLIFKVQDLQRLSRQVRSSACLAIEASSCGRFRVSRTA
jgi:ParB family chromosome partitioning protein